MPEIPPYQSRDDAPPRRWSAGSWLVLLITWAIGLPIWFLYLWLFGYYFLKLLG